MILWNSYAQALLEVAPSRILASLLGEYELPEKWRHLSSYPVTERPGLEKFVLKHPISAVEKPLEKLSNFWFNASEEERRHFIETLRKAEESIARKIESADSMEKFARLWNDLPEKLEEEYQKALEGEGFENARDIAGELVHFPADPYVPDHDWLSRLDVYARLRDGNARLLRFKLSPVQGFIANARTERDLWAGSHILSLLTYLAISELWRSFGPHALVIPHLRDQPFFEHELGKELDERELQIANMPNKVLAIVPADEDVESLGEKIEDSIRGFLEKLFRAAWEFYGMGEFFEKKDVYDLTVRKYFSITVETVPLTKLDGIIEESLKAYLETLPDNFESEVHHYPELFTLLDQYTDFSSVRHDRSEQPGGFRCTLCGENLAIGGNDKYEKDGRVEYVKYKHVTEKWNDLRERLWARKIYDIKEKERLCPLCLTKRFYPRFYVLWVKNYPMVGKDASEIKAMAEGKKKELKRFRSVSEVALRRPTAEALKRFENGELKANEKPVTWYDVFLYLALDVFPEWRDEFRKPTFTGDKAKEFTDKLRELSEALRLLFERLAPNAEVFYVESLTDKEALAKVYGVNVDKLKDIDVSAIARALKELVTFIGEPPKYYAILKMDGDNMGKVLSGSKAVKDVGEYFARESTIGANRPATPVIHTTITRSLSEFAVKHVSAVSETHDAELLYAGGDDVLALSSTDEAFGLAYEVQGEFTEDWVGYEPLQGETRSMSGGILITYYKEPLYTAVPGVNGLEHLAKESGRNGLAIGYRKHSGAFYRVAVNWELFKGGYYSSLLREFKREKISRKLIYELDTVTWPNEPRAVLNLLKYEFLRHSNYDKKKEREGLIEALANFLWLVRNVRAFLTKEDLRGMENGPDESRLEEFNEEIKEVIVSDPEKPGRFRWEDIKALAEELIDGEEPHGEAWFDELSKRLSSELAGVVFKKQVHGAATLLKILLEAGVGA
ncbi:hypothetical protein TEU_10800 [Thermococcus eurythermalis]|uniref:GGDEF domain-containing protein n=1 Tax=Thermococcus eurythermalis TaxID=1505907 RepID=A0A097QWB6_9EURY|nr:type III-B CRISPR-associated protein Cas10/Cmr2 [Thermococcus eurythermalis]AIU70782.1 hypothetical protein TEU_10800 [Thermococcus eurythermalis]